MFNKDGLSESVIKKVESWEFHIKDIKRPDWNTYFLAMAYLVSLRSSDARTQTGCVLVDQNKSILGTGYNGTIRGINDNILPNYNEDKYPFFIHAEMNCLLNCARQGIKTENSILYLTGPPCFNCIQSLYQAGISKIYHGNQYIFMMDNYEYKDNIEIFKNLTQNKMPLISLDFDKDSLKELICETYNI